MESLSGRPTSPLEGGQAEQIVEGSESSRNRECRRSFWRGLVLQVQFFRIFWRSWRTRRKILLTVGYSTDVAEICAFSHTCYFIHENFANAYLRATGQPEHIPPLLESEWFEWIQPRKTPLKEADQPPGALLGDEERP